MNKQEKSLTVENLEEALAELDAVKEDTPYQKAILNGLSRKPIYRGTVPEHVKQKRRAKNRVARASRKANRK